MPLGLQLHIVQASTDREIDAAFAKLAQLRPGGLVIATDTFFNSRNTLTAALALQYRHARDLSFSRVCSAPAV